MKYSCGVIKDLLPLYHDGVCSEESIEAIQEHLKCCSSCEKYFSNMKEADNIHTEGIKVEEKSKKMLVKFKKVIFRKKVIACLLSLAVLITGIVCAYLYMQHKLVAVQYGNKNIVVSKEEKGVVARLKGEVYSMAQSKTIEVEINDKKENIVYFSLAASLWDKSFKSGEDIVYSEYMVAYSYMDENKTIKSGAEDIDKIYYYTGDYENLENLTSEELEKINKKSVLLWSK